MRYYLGTKFVPKVLADDILEKLPVITMQDNNEMYYYDEGVWLSGAENRIASMGKEMTRDELTNHHKNELLFQIQTMTYHEREEFDKDINLLHLNNGIFNIEEERTNDFDPSILSTIRLPMEYDSGADCPTIKAFVEEIAPNNYETIQELFGYCLWRKYHIQKAFMMVGEGANGKTTLLNLLQTFIGSENVSNVSLQEICYNRFASGRLYGKLANIHSDLTDKALSSTGVFKMLTGGDRITCERKFKEPFEFSNHAKLIFSANKLPEVKDNTDAFHRRWIIIPFPKKFEGDNKDPHMLDKLTTPEELSGCFNWAIEGLKKLFKDGCFAEDEETAALRERYVRLSDSLKVFVWDHLETDPGSYITKEELYLKYVDYCSENNLTPKSKTVVGRELPEHIRTGEIKPSVGGRQAKAWSNLKFKEDSTTITSIT